MRAHFRDARTGAVTVSHGFTCATLLSHSAPSRMSATAMMRHAMRDENTRYHSLFAFSPERVLGLKRAAEVRVTTSRVS